MGKLDSLNSAEHCIYAIRHHMTCEDAPLLRGVVAQVIEKLQDHVAEAYGFYLQDLDDDEIKLRG